MGQLKSGNAAEENFLKQNALEDVGVADGDSVLY
jgi:hypothetical protein